MLYEAPTPMTDYRAVGVDIFAGGFTVGMSKYFDIQAHLEEGSFGVDTFRANFPHVPVWTARSRWPEPAHWNDIDVMYGNPPCSPWSQNGRSMRRGSDNWRTDPNVDFGRRYLEYGLQARPKFWVFESVPPIQRSEFLLDVAQAWMREGYAFTLVRQDAKFWGLPQQRRRCFLVAHRLKVDWRPHVEPLTASNPCGDVLETMVPAADASAVAQPFDYGLDEMLPRLPQGGSLRDLWEKENVEAVAAHEALPHPRPPLRGRPLLMIHRLRPERASCTIVGMNVYVHPHHDRALTPQEMAVLCGYPVEYQWVESGGYLPAQVAKSVTPSAAEFLAANLARALDANIPAEVESRRATFWAPSSRTDDFRFIAHTEPWNTDHNCTLTTEVTP